MSLSRRSKALLPGIIFMILLAIFVMRFGAMILALTIIPAIVAFFLDHQPKKPVFKIVAACNISAAMPFIVPIIDFSLKKQYSEAGQVLDDPMGWAFIYCGAAAGWCMLYLSKFVARIVTLMHYDYSITLLEKKQSILIEEWGDEIIQSHGKRNKNN